MADLLARFRLVDEMSEKLDSMTQRGQDMASSFEQAGEAANSAFDGIESGVSSAVSSVDGVAQSLENYKGAAGDAGAAAEDFTGSLSGYGAAAGEAAAQTDYWTDAVGSYDKSAMEAVYTTEELVEMGHKSADALQAQEEMFDLCERSATFLNKAMEATTDIQDELTKAMDAAAETASELADNENVSAEAKAELAKAAADAEEAMRNLGDAQKEAQAAMEAYDEVMMSGTTDLNELEAAAERAMHAAENLAEANGKATEATEELGKAAENATEEAEKGGEEGVNAIEAISTALVAAGITAELKQIAQAAYELADAFSEAESIVVNATGATGEALDGLMQSTLQVYAKAKSGTLEDVAGAIGEINTRMGLTGDELTEVTGLFMDYAQITGSNVVSSVQNVTKVMNQWRIEGENVESVMDKLAYAAQISGASVDSLSSNLITGAASFQNAGLSIDNTIQMLADFELAGINGTTAIMAIRTAVNNFSKDGLDANEALQATIEQIATMGDQSEATALAVETFGSRAGQQLALAIQNGTISVDTFNATMDEADGTLRKTAEASQTLSQKWEQANRSISAAFTSALEPTLSKLSSGLASVVQGIGDFLNEHPTLTKAITAVAVGVGVVVAAVTAVAFVAKVAIPAVVGLGAAFNAALGPIGWVALGIAAVSAAVVAFIALIGDANDETAGMTATTRAQYYELQDLNAEYERTCEEYGDTSEEALRLKYQVDDLSATFEASRQTLEEFTAEVEALCQSVDEVTQSFQDGMTEIHNNEVGALALIQKYEDLASQGELTAVQQRELDAVTKKLAEDFPDVAAAIGDATGNTEQYVEAMKRACEQQAEQQRLQQAEDTYVEALQKRQQLTEEIEKTQADLNAELEAHNMVWDETMQTYSNGWYTSGSPWAAWTTDLDDYQDALDSLLAAQAENEATLEEIEQTWQDISDAEAEAEEQVLTYEQAAALAFQSVQGEIEELCQAYDDAYQAALSSFEGQFSLFDEATTESETYMNATVENARAALDSQLAYWDSYLANVETLKSISADDLGITQENYEALMAYVQDGSEEAAGLAQSMVENINAGNEEAVAQLANTVGEVQAKQQEASATIAEWQTNFNATMDELEQRMNEAVDNLNLDSEAAASAKATIDSYAASIRAGQSDAVAAAKAVADGVAATLAANPVTVRVNAQHTTAVSGHAKGTTDAEAMFIAGEEGPELIARRAEAYAGGTTDSTDYYIAGEHGPELIVGEQGSTVFPTEETDRLINALNYRQPLSVYPTAAGGVESGGAERRGGAGETVKRILLEIVGSGEIDAGGSSKETVLEILHDQLKPVLMNIIQSEIYEEGDLSYEY
ncbi:TP901 family phage tail tape measure protein [Fusobacterium naviforme]|nr:phage tail tape measure protein [Fusobacterium naviforme]PSL10190.1 TP901 family phage tail tape measure protein [Fusobacterium naviforme]STO27600.1 Phage-related minor tail protein [Fusobacterium naviforme]